jgi:hypothetical protein
MLNHYPILTSIFDNDRGIRVCNASMDSRDVVAVMPTGMYR